MQKSKITVCLVFLLIALASAIFIQTASADNVYYVSMPHYGTVTSITCAFTGTDVMGDCTYTLQVKDPSSNIVFYDSGTAESGGTDVWKTIVVPLDDDSFDAGNFEVTWVLNFMSGELLTHDEYLNGYVAYYLLTVNNGGHGTTTGQGYYPSGSTAYAGLTSGTVSGATGTRYVFSSWGGDASGSNYAQSNAITMNAEKTATASWTTQYYLTVNNGGHSSATGAGWYNSGATAYAGVAASPITEGTTRYVFASWTGDASGTTYSQSNGITMNAAKTATASWTTQHLLTVTGGDSTTSGYNNGVWVNHGSTTSSTSNYVFSASATQRSNLYRWKLDSGSWTNLARSGSGTAGTGSITMDAAHTVTWESVTQNKLTVSGGNGVTYGTAPPTGDVGWYDNTQSTTVSSNGIWGRSGGSGTRVSSWKLDSGSNNNVATTGTVTTDSVTMSTYHTITFNAVTQYYLTVTGGNSITYGANPTITGDTGWYDTGSSTTVTSNWVWSTVTGQSRTVITNYAKDSVNQNPARQNTGTLTTSSITMTASHTIAFTSTTQYYLTVSGGNNIAYSLSSQTSDNWYDSGTSTTVSSDGVYNRASGTGTRTTSWRLDSGTINTVSTVNTVTTSSVTMSTYHTITFASTLQYQIYYDGGVTNTLNTITSPTVSGDNYWYDTGTPVSLSIYGVWGRTSTTGNRISAYQINGGASTPVASTSVVGILSILPITEAQNITTTTKTQYKLTVIGGSSITYGTSTPISNDEGWYDNDQSTTVSSPWIYNEFSGSRTAITNYAIDSANQNPTRQYSGTLTTSSIAMSAAHTVNFATTTQYYLTVSSEYGTVTLGNDWYDSGATAYAGLSTGTYGSYYFSSWDTGGTNYAQSNAITMNSAKLSTAIWSLTVTYKITTYTSGNGTITPSNVTLNSGESQSFNITAASGYGISQIYFDGEPTDMELITTYVLSGGDLDYIDSNHTITAIFNTLVTGEGLSIGSFTAPIVVTSGTQFTISATANANNTYAELYNVTINLTGGITLTWNNLDEFNATDLNGYVTFISGTSTVNPSISNTSVLLQWTIRISSSMPEGYISIIAAEVTDTLGESATNSQSNLFTFIPLTTGGGGGGGGGGGSKPQNNTIIVTTPTPEPFMPQTPEALLGVLLIVSILAIAVIVGVAKSKTAQQLWSKRNMEANSW